MRSSRWILRSVGMLLLAAGALKASGLGVDPVARTGVFSAPAFQFLVIAFELILGVWLLSGSQPIGSWMVTLLTFIGFAGVTFHQGWIGQATCGCAGRLITINPWLAFAVDIAIVSALVRFRPELQPLWDHRARVARIAAGVVGGYLLALGCAAALGHYHYGSMDAALAALRQERLSITPATLDMGQGVPGETREATLNLGNRTEHPIRVIGGTADCSCTVLGDIPVTVPPGETRSITIQLRLPNSQGRFTRIAELMIDDQGTNNKIGFRLTGRINQTPENAEQVQRTERRTQ